MSVNVYMTFKGQAEEAMNFYAQALGTDKPDLMYYKDMPEDPNFPVPEEAKNLIMHGSITFNGQYIMFSDVMPNQPFNKGNNMSILIDLDDENDLKRYYDNLLDGGQIQMPFGPTFWAKAFGSLIDKYGIEWQFNSSLDE